MSTEPLVKQLDERYGRTHAHWCIYRAATGEWVVMVNHKSITGATIEEALASAVAYVPIPEIPRRPVEIQAEQLEPRKSGKYWHLYYGEQFMGVLKSKRDCKRVAPKIAERSVSAAKQWDSQYAHYLSLVEGTDFKCLDC